MLRAFVSIAAVLALSRFVFGQSAEKTPAFELADVHVAAPSALSNINAPINGTPRGGRYEMRGASMVDLIRNAYGITDDKIFGGPSWLGSDRFDVVAKTPAGVTPDSARLMLRTLLAERFDLKVHEDMKPLPVYVLSLGKTKHKLKESTGAQSGCQGQQQTPQPGVIPYAQVSCHNLTSAQIAENLRQMAGGYFDKPVIDQTQLEGTWDFDLKWTARAQLAAAGADGISAFDAVDKQLGLKVELQQVAMPVIVVDNVNRKPTDNQPGVADMLPPEKPEFETAEIKPSPPGTQGIGVRYSQGGRVDAMGTLKDLIAIANEVLPNLASDYVIAPESAKTHYTIVAKVPSTGIGAATRDGGREQAPPLTVALMMLRSMLEERFKLKSHREDRPTTVYALLAPKTETKLKKAEPNERAGCRPNPAAVPATSTGPMNAITCVNTTMDELVKNIPQWAGAYIDHPVVNASGIEGGWNFTLMWTPRQALENRPAGTAPAGGAAASDPGGISLWEAVDKQLGLKLEKGTRPLSVIVVDHLEEKPSD